MAPVKEPRRPTRLSGTEKRCDPFHRRKNPLSDDWGLRTPLRPHGEFASGTTPPSRPDKPAKFVVTILSDRGAETCAAGL